jgi:hypothetical protein
VTSKKDTTRTASEPAASSPPSAAGKRASVAALNEGAARRGRVRDALAALGNVEAMLRSRSGVAIDAEVDELRRGLHALHEAFEAAALEASDDQREARRALEAFAAGRIRAVERALADLNALDVPSSLATIGVDLDTAAGLLELTERASDGVPVEVSVANLAEQALHLAWTLRSHKESTISIRSTIGDCSVACDPHVVARVLAVAVAMVREMHEDVVVRTRVDDDAGVIEVTGITAEDETARMMQTRLLPRIAPTDAVLAAAVRAAGITLAVEPGRILLRCPRVVS